MTADDLDTISMCKISFHINNLMDPYSLGFELRLNASAENFKYGLMVLPPHICHAPNVPAAINSSTTPANAIRPPEGSVVWFVEAGVESIWAAASCEAGTCT